MELTSDNVTAVFEDCLFKEGEDTSKAVKVDGIIGNFGFNPERLELHKQEICAMLLQLPDNFQKEKGGGWTFLNACNDKNGKQWTDLHAVMEQLFVLGIAVGKAKWCMPKELWQVFPGAMPYVVVL